MPISTRAPYPFDVRIGGTGYMLARDSSGPMWRESEPQTPLPDGPGEQKDIQNDFSGGVGLKQRTGEPLGQRMLANASGAAAYGSVMGMYGYLMPAWEITSTTVLGGSPIRAIHKFSYDAKFYAAAGAALYSSSDLSSWSLVGTLPSTILRLGEFQGTNSTPLLWIAQLYGALYTHDGTTLTADGATRRTGIPTGCFVTTDSGATYTDVTTAVADTSTSTTTGTTLNSLPTGTGYVVLFYEKPFTGCFIDITNTNSTAATTLTASYWGTSGWTALSGLVDGTSVGAISMAADGTLAWTRPAAEWVKTTISGTGQHKAGFAVKLSFDKQLDGSTSWNSVQIKYQEEASDFKVVGGRLVKAFDHNRTGSSDDGGRTANWSDSNDPLGDYSGKAIGLMAGIDVSGRATAYLLRTNGFGASNKDGSAQEYAPELFDKPVSTTDDQAYTEFLGECYFSAANGGFYKVNPLDASILPCGPEKLMQSEQLTLQGRMTAAVGDGTQFLFAARYQDTAAASYLFAYGSYRLEADPSGVVVSGHSQAWHMLGGLGSVKVHSMTVAYYSTQPYLLAGASDGKIYMLRLPQGHHPLEANSGCRWSTVTGYAQLPTILGADPSRALDAYAIRITGRNISTTNSVTVQTRAQGATTWTQQGVVTASGTLLAFGTPTSTYGLDVRLDLANGSATVPPLIESVAVSYVQDEEPARQSYTATLVADDRVMRLDGRLIPRRAKDWDDLADTAAASGTPIAIVAYGGESLSGFIRQKRVAALHTDAFGQKRRAISVDILTSSA